VVIAATGLANLASICSAFRRAGAEPVVSTDPGLVATAGHLVLPGVGSFGKAMGALRSAGLCKALCDRVNDGLPTLGICLGMQLFFEGSEEAPGTAGLGIVPGALGRFAASLPVPQLGWNRVTPPGPESAVEEGWAYFANSYRLVEKPRGFISSLADYGGPFVAAIEGGRGLLLCQFHPELSGAWGLALLKRWLGADAAREGDKP
jgi:imidazole glycerol-phosphate synthase subunit HisH